MDLSYPPAIQASLDRLSQALADVVVKEELEVCERPVELWPVRATNGAATAAASPLAQVAEFRKFGAYALPLPELLAKADRAYIGSGNTRTTALGWPDASSPWQSGDLLTVEIGASEVVNGKVSVAPFCVPATSLMFVAQKSSDVALVAVLGVGQVERSGDAFTVSFSDQRAHVLAEGADAVAAWDCAVLWERLALLGLTLGLIDRCWRIALDALCEGKRAGNVLADEQVAQFQLADNDIERLSAENLILDAAVDMENGKASAKDKMALVRYFTSGQAERCAARALHVAQLFSPGMVPIARWFVQRAHHLAMFSAAREHEVRSASNGVIAGLSLE
jgi:Acyl-CoA dehydrogenase, C-terminal domain